MTKDRIYRGLCFCGQVEIAVKGDPQAMGLCHCASCRAWSAAPVTAFAMWPTSSVEVTRGVELVASFTKSPLAIRKWCKACGGHLMTEVTPWEMTDVYPVILAGLAFKPTEHIHYQARALPIRDGLPKYKDLPADIGGSGDMMPE